MQDVRIIPASFIEQVVFVLRGIELDPCASPNALVPAARQYFCKDDGLSQSWEARTIFCIPPYSLADEFMRKAHSEWSAERAECIALLVPAKIHTKVFRKIAGDADIVFLRDRSWFWQKQRTSMRHSAPFSSMVMIFGADERVIERAWTTWGWVYISKRMHRGR